MLRHIDDGAGRAVSATGATGATILLGAGMPQRSPQLRPVWAVELTRLLCVAARVKKGVAFESGWAAAGRPAKNALPEAGGWSSCR